MPSRSLAILALLVVAAALAYYPALQGAFLWDDNAHITQPALRSFQGLGRIWFQLGATQQYYPLLHTAFWIEYQLWGEQPLGYHLTNLLLHATAAWLVYLILRKLAAPGALFAAAIFALHPVMVESVAWVTEQKNTLSAVFYLAAILAYLHFDQTRRSSHYATALALFILGLLSKTVTATLPAALLIIFWWQRGHLSWRRDLKPLIPFFLLGAVAGLFTAWVEWKIIGAEGTPFEISLVERGLLAGLAIWFYLGKLLLPVNLIFTYPRWTIDPTIWWQWLFPAATVAVFIVLWRARTKCRAPLAGWLFFVGTLFPVLGFFNVYPFLFSFVADHFQYLASLGIIVPLAAAITLSLARIAPPSLWISNVVYVVVLGTLGTLTWRQAEMYSDSTALYQATIKRNPGCWLAYNNLGVNSAISGRLQEAMDEYRQALLLRPNYAEAHFNLGNALARDGRPEEAVAQYQEALEVRPAYPEAHNNLGNLLQSSGRFREAIDHYEQALNLNPYYAEAHFNLGSIEAKQERTQQAIEHFMRAIEIRPSYAEAHKRLALVYLDMQQQERAILHFKLASQFAPHDAEIWYNLGKALLAQGETDEALRSIELAAQLDPNNPQIHNNFGTALARSGRLKEAVKEFEETLRLEPNNVQIYANLTRAYMQLQQPDDAVAAAQKAIELARSQGQTALAGEIETWLTNYRGTLSNQNQAPPPREPSNP